MTGQQLKNSIRQMAVQGTLVPQDPNDEPASVLVERIRAEKEKLIKEKKIKKEKNPSYIFRGADNLPYEQVGKNEPVCIADEVPFEIPNSWTWVRLSNLSENIPNAFADGPFGSNLKKEHYTDRQEVRLIQLSNIGEDGWRNGNTKYTTYSHAATLERSCVKPGSIVIAKMMPAGRAIIVPNLEQDYILSSDAVKFLPHPCLDKDYLVFAINSPAFRDQVIAEAHGVTRVRTSLRKLQTYLLPIPPIEEQKRIVSRLQDVFPLVKEYEEHEATRLSFDNEFPDRLKKSILQWAVQGKLVPQDPDDEPASVLLERIRKEKVRLVKEGKIKKDKNESVIFRRDNSHYEKRGKIEVCIDDEIPFDIPDSWEWVRFYEIAFFENGDRSSKYPIEADYVPDGIPFFGAKDMGAKYMDFATVRFISQEKFDQLGNGKLQDDDMICLLRGNVGKTRIFKRSDKYLTGFICAQMMIIRCIDKRILEYLYSVISSPYYTRAIEAKVTGTAVRQLPAKEVAKILIPLPPVAEQQRILSIIQELSTPLITL